MDVGQEVRVMSPGRTRLRKAPSAYLVIGEVADELGVTTVALRHWERCFPHIHPKRMSGWIRRYSPEEVQLLKSIRRLLYEERYTTEGVALLLSEYGSTDVRTQQNFSHIHIAALRDCLHACSKEVVSGPFLSLGDVANRLAIPKHTVRFWEERFPVLMAKRSNGGVRRYRECDVALLNVVANLLLIHKYSYEGVAQMLVIAQEVMPLSSESGGNTT